MTFRITIDQESGVQIVRLAGWLESADITELERVVGETSGSLRLDLTELRSADQVGVRLLRAFQTRGVPLVGASAFVRLLVGVDASRPPPTGGPKRRGGQRWPR